MQGLSSRNVPFKRGCEMLGLHREPDDKLKPGLFVNKTKLIFGVTTIAVFVLVVCLTVISVTSQKPSSISSIQATNLFDEEAKTEAETIQGNTTLETSTEALKYVVISHHPRRSKSVELAPWQRQRANYSDGYAQLESYRNAKKVHSVSDILRYMHGERYKPIKLSGTWVKTPMNSDMPQMKPPYHWDNLQKFKPTHPSEVNMLATQSQTYQYGPRFSHKVTRPTVGPFKPLPDYPSHTQAIFHPYSLENGSEFADHPNHKLTPIGSSQEVFEDNETRKRGESGSLKPFSVLLDIYPVTLTTPSPIDRTKSIRGNKAVPLQVHVPSLTQINIKPSRTQTVLHPASSTPPTSQRMLLHLNLYPRKKNKERIAGKSNKNKPYFDADFKSAETFYDLYDEADGSKGLPMRQALLFSSNMTNTTASKRISSWCYQYENDLLKEKNMFFIMILRSFCRNMDSDENVQTSSTIDTKNVEVAFGQYAKLIQEHVSKNKNSTDTVSNVNNNFTTFEEAFDVSQESNKGEEKTSKTVIKPDGSTGKMTGVNDSPVSTTEYSLPSLSDTPYELPPPRATSSLVIQSNN